MGKFNRRGIGGGDGNASALERLFGAVLDVASTTRACSLPCASLKLLPTGPSLFSRKRGEAAHREECRLSGHAGDRTTLAAVAAWPCGWGRSVPTPSSALRRDTGVWCSSVG